MSDKRRAAQPSNDNYGEYGSTDRDRSVLTTSTGRDTDRGRDTERDGRRGGGCCCEGGCCCCRVREEAYDPQLRESRHTRARARMEARLDRDEQYGRYGNPDYEGQFRRRPTRNDRIADPDYVYRDHQQRDPYQRQGNWQERMGPGYLAPEDQAAARRVAARYTQNDLAYDMNPRAYRDNYSVGGHYGNGRYGNRNGIDLRFGNGQFGIHVGIGDGRPRVDFDYGNGGRYGRNYPYDNGSNYPYDYGRNRGNYPYDSDYGRQRRGGGYDYGRNQNRYPWDERYPGDDWMYGNRNRYPNDDYYGRNRNNGRYPNDDYYYGRNDDYYGRNRNNGRYPNDDYYGRNRNNGRYPNDDYYGRNDDYYRRNPNRYPWDERYPGDGRSNYPYDYGRNNYPYGRNNGRDGVYFGIGPDGRFYGGFQKDGIGIGIGTGGDNRRNHGGGYYDQYGRQIDPRIARHGGYYDQHNHYPEDYSYRNQRNQRYPQYGNNYPYGDYQQYDSRYGRRHGGNGVDLGLGVSIQNGKLYTNFGGIRARIMQ